MLEYLKFRIVLMLSRNLPLKFLYWIALRLADFKHLIDHRGRKAVRQNLSGILGDSVSHRELKSLVRWTFRNFGKYLAEFFKFEQFSKEFIEKKVVIQGLRYVDEALSFGKGVIVNSAHFSNWEMGAAVLSALGYPVWVVALRHQNDRINQLFLNMRNKVGVKVIPSDGAMRACYEVLAKNEILCILGDRPTSDRGVYLEFFGRPTFFPAGAARLSSAGGAPIIPAFFPRLEGDRFSLVFEPPLYPVEGQTKEERVARTAQQYVKVYEKYFRQYPSQWELFQPRWPEEVAQQVRVQTSPPFMMVKGLRKPEQEPCASDQFQSEAASQELDPRS